MERNPSRHLEQILARAQETCTNVQVREFDISENRALLQLTADLGVYRIAVTEIVRRASRGYAYYLLRGNQVMLGWDNAPDRTALRLQYGGEFAKHIHQEIPHEHRGGTIALTDEKTFDNFLDTAMRFLE